MGFDLLLEDHFEDVEVLHVLGLDLLTQALELLPLFLLRSRELVLLQRV